MRTEWRASMVRVALSAAAMLGIAMGGWIAPRWIAPRWTAFAQAGAAFSVAPVPGVRAGSDMASVSRTPQRIAFHAWQVGNIIAFAYGFPPDRVERRPQWMYDDFYDVAVATAAPASLPEQKVLLQKLLEERFGLVVHRISNEGPVYFMVPGAKVNLTETKEADSVDIPRFRTGLGLQPGTSGLPSGLVCVARHVSMSDLAAWLYSQIQVPVIDKTGITGLYDIEIPGWPIRGGLEGTIRAVRNALGLDFELHRAPVETLIIDHVEQPKQN